MIQKNECDWLKKSNRPEQMLGCVDSLDCYTVAVGEECDKGDADQSQVEKWEWWRGLPT